MKNYHILKITFNFLAVVLLISLIATPFFFAKNFAKVAGVKSTTPYLLVSQIEKFPNMKFLQEENKYKISFEKFGSSQAYLGVLIINNPTDRTQTYSLDTLGETKVFFGEDLNNLITQISVPSSVSVPISLLSTGESPVESQTVEFKILVR